MDSEQLAELEAGETLMMGAVLYGTDGAVLDSLWGIHLRAPWSSDPYRRVVAAELALAANVCHPLDRSFIA